MKKALFLGFIGMLIIIMICGLSISPILPTLNFSQIHQITELGKDRQSLLELYNFGGLTQYEKELVYTLQRAQLGDVLRFGTNYYSHCNCLAEFILVARYDETIKNITNENIFDVTVSAVNTGNGKEVETNSMVDFISSNASFGLFTRDSGFLFGTRQYRYVYGYDSVAQGDYTEENMPDRIELSLRNTSTNIKRDFLMPWFRSVPVVSE